MTPLDDAYFPRGMSHEPRWRVHPHHDSLFVLWVGLGLGFICGKNLGWVRVFCHAKNRIAPEDESKLCRLCEHQARPFQL